MLSDDWQHRSGPDAGVGWACLACRTRLSACSLTRSGLHLVLYTWCECLDSAERVSKCGDDTMIAPKLMNVFGVAACLGTAALLVHVTVSDKEPAGSALIGPQTVQAVPSERPATGRSVRDAGQERLLAADLSSGERPGLDQTTLSDPYAGALQQESIIILSQDSDATGGQYASADVSGGSTILFGSDGDSIWRSYSGSEDLASAALAGGSGGGSGFSTGGSSAGGGSAATGDLDFAGGDGGEADEDLIVIPIGGDTDTGGDTAPGGDDAWDGDIPVYDDPLDTGDDPGAGDTPVDTGGTGGGTGARDDTPVGDDTDTGQDSPTAPDDGSQDTGDGGQDATTPDDATPDPDTGSGSGGSVITPRPWIRPGDPEVSGTVFYVDPQLGNDDNTGSASSPWKTCAYAVRQLAPGDILRLRSGNYGHLDLGGSLNSYGAPDNWITYEADEGHAPVFESMKLGSRSDTRHYYLMMRGLTISPGGMEIVDVYSVRLSAMRFVGHWDSDNSANTSSTAIYVRGSRPEPRYHNLVIENCEITQYTGAITLIDVSGTTPLAGTVAIRGNYLHKFTNSAIRLYRDAVNPDARIIIEDNHICDQDPVPLDGAPPHGSAITIRTGYVTVRGNVVRSFGTTRGIRAYPGHFDGRVCFAGNLMDQSTPFQEGEEVYCGATLIGQCKSWSDTELQVYRATEHFELPEGHLVGRTSGAQFSASGITYMNAWGGYCGLVVENNLFYDSYNPFVAEFLDLNGDAIFRNNTFIGAHSADYSRALWYYYSAFRTVPYPRTGNGVTFKNNIAVGRVDFDGPLDSFRNNIVYALCANKAFITSLESNIIVTDNGIMGRVPYFESGDLGRDFFLGGTLFDQYSFTRNDGKPHGVELSSAYHLAPGSPAVNFGDVDVAVAAGSPCGVVGPDGFLVDPGYERDENHHSAGCYEKAVAPPVE